MQSQLNNLQSLLLQILKYDQLTSLTHQINKNIIFNAIQLFDYHGILCLNISFNLFFVYLIMQYFFADRHETSVLANSRVAISSMVRQRPRLLLFVVLCNYVVPGEQLKFLGLFRIIMVQLYVIIQSPYIDFLVYLESLWKWFCIILKSLTNFQAYLEFLWISIFQTRSKLMIMIDMNVSVYVEFSIIFYLCKKCVKSLTLPSVLIERKKNIFKVVLMQSQLNTLQSLLLQILKYD